MAMGPLKRVFVHPARQVIDEVRDSQSRHVLDTLPFGISVREADEESYAAVK